MAQQEAPKQTEKRSAKVDAMVDAMADFVLENGLTAASLRPLAKAAGTSDRMLLYYFADKHELMAAILERVADRMVAMLDAIADSEPMSPDALLTALMPLLSSDLAWPFMRIWIALASEGANGDSNAQNVGKRLGQRFLKWGKGRLIGADEAERHKEASRMLVMIEGQVMLKALGLEQIGKDALG
ncbi:TetR/AcrR family transcriptional regulator [Alterisphingorhabdus coralli]|uniref:TetR/AcrR family transcriptional regulator n=1 Tax=Alterisphingorhabdus coralli TaxID=3071408 RepID=A0AA97F534_9SPHN|nr:TetR/AcrR family transcriptional regulator [Parasphingorhabdus sp. SCSIO 66989]WOE74489.1 TetR/AcrR family transcriptional regulator [Parasphingorhabdus sp. SCSIO 66989]